MSELKCKVVHNCEVERIPKGAYEAVIYLFFFFTAQSSNYVTFRCYIKIRKEIWLCNFTVLNSVVCFYKYVVLVLKFNLQEVVRTLLHF